ncbi:hypothetical protein GCM10008965_03590 [Methylorubrum aminovorans]|nr:hypothetical protein GCM10025880_14310 [Methylorubrum aminovorans]
MRRPLDRSDGNGRAARENSIRGRRWVPSGPKPLERNGYDGNADLLCAAGKADRTRSAMAETG